MKPHTSNHAPSLTVALLSRYALFLMLVYGLAVLAGSHIKINYMDEALRKAGWDSETIMRETLGHEQVLFRSAVPSTKATKNIYHLLLEASTDIRFDDVRSLFGAELPGFSLYSTRIFIAGEGLDYTNLPKETPPPPNIDLEIPPAPEAPDKEKKEPSPKDEQAEKTVLLYHSHSWESFKPILKGTKNETAAASTDPDKNISITGREIGQVLEENGIGFVHDTSGGWDYDESYQASRKIVQSLMKKHDDLTYLIDIHRDSASGKQTTTTIERQKYARIVFIIGEANKHYSANLYLAKQLSKRLEERYPGILRGVVGKSKSDGNGMYNQDLSKNALLVEIGGVDNTSEEIKRTSRAFAEVLSDLIKEREK